MVIHLVADEKLCTERIMIRAQNSGDQVRVDDNIESLRKRFATQQTECLPVIDYYKEKNKVHEVCCDTHSNIISSHNYYYYHCYYYYYYYNYYWYGSI
jgi:adenylate kinase family enzyme